MPDGSGPRPATPSRARASAPHKPRDLDAERNSRILLIIGIVVAISAVVAGVVIFTGGDGTTTATPTTQPHVQASGTALVMGKNAGARHQVVVYEDFACPACRDFETSSRDFLQAAALKGVVRVEYRPFHLLPAAYSTQALGAWGAVLQHGAAAQALALHDLLFDRQPAAGAASPRRARWRRWARKAGVTDPDACSPRLGPPTRPSWARPTPPRRRRVSPAPRPSSSTGGGSRAPRRSRWPTPCSGSSPEAERPGRAGRGAVRPRRAAMLGRHERPRPTSSPGCPRPSCTCTTSAPPRRASSPSWPRGTPARGAQRPRGALRRVLRLPRLRALHRGLPGRGRPDPRRRRTSGCSPTRSPASWPRASRCATPS